jgi:peptidoglycan/LPS O-acetylase OafA/YrhL
MSTTVGDVPLRTHTAPVTIWVYRPELDGLRTLAVFLVLLFHCGVGAFGGGFIGVDVFFVLSGFLVSSILLEEAWSRGTIDLPGFLARRVRRLLPAAVIVVVATCVISVLTSTVIRRLPWVGDAQSALLYVSNWRFLFESRDYFGADVDKSPFQHFWSLSVEEQFYFVFPLLLLVVACAGRQRRPRARALVVVVGILAVGSLASQLYWGMHDPERAYYATDARIYQLLAGVLGALAWRRSARRGDGGLRSGSATRRPGSTLALLGLLVLVGNPVVPVSASVRGLLATAVALPLILAVMSGVDPAARWLLTRPVVTYLGRISYGIYLWHWPVVLTLHQIFRTGPFVIVAMTAAISTGLAAVSFEVLEQPIRRSPRLALVSLPTVLVGVGLSALVAVTVVPRILGSDQPPAIAAHQRNSTHTVLPTGPVPAGLHWKEFGEQKGLDDTWCTRRDTHSCLLHHGNGPRVLLVGDSHSKVLGEAFLDLAKRQDFTLYGSVVGSCSWFPHTTATRHTETENRDCHAVVLTQLPRSRLIADGDPGLDFPQLASRAVREVTGDIESAGARTVIVRTMLTTSISSLSCLSAARDQSECEEVQSEKLEPLDSYYLTAAADDPDVSTIDVNRVMCPGFPLCAALLDGQPVWRDRRHYLPSTLVAHDQQIWQQLRGTGYFPRR